MQHPAPAQHGPSGQESGVTSFGQVVVAVAWNRILNLAMPFERIKVHTWKKYCDIFTRVTSS